MEKGWGTWWFREKGDDRSNRTRNDIKRLLKLEVGACLNPFGSRVVFPNLLWFFDWNVFFFLMCDVRALIERSHLCWLIIETFSLISKNHTWMIVQSIFLFVGSQHITTTGTWWVPFRFSLSSPSCFFVFFFFSWVTSFLNPWTNDWTDRTPLCSGF